MNVIYVLGAMVIILLVDDVKNIIRRIKRRRKNKKHTEFQKNSEKEVE